MHTVGSMVMRKKPSNVATPPHDAPAPKGLDAPTSPTPTDKNLRISSEELKHLLARCLNKDEKAWEIVFSGLYGLVKDVVLRAGLVEEDVDDAIAESFYRILYFIKDVAASQRPLPYIGALAHYTAIGLRQKAERNPALALAYEQSRDPNLLASPQWGVTPRQGVTIMATQINQGLVDALQQLRPVERQLIRLKYIEDLCYDEVAYIVGKDISTTRVATFRAVRKLKQLVSPEIREMVNDSHELWNRIASLQISDKPDLREDTRTQLLLEDYVADKNSMPLESRAEIEALLARSFRLRERKVTLERTAILDEDVAGHAPPDRIPESLLQRLLQEARSIGSA